MPLINPDPIASSVFPFEQAKIVRPSICLDAVTFASTYPNAATILNSSNNCALRSLSAGGLAVAGNSNVSSTNQIFAASTEANIPTSKTFTNIGAFPTGGSGSAIYIFARNIFWCPVTAKYYVGIIFYDLGNGNNAGLMFSIDPATGTSVILLNLAFTASSNTAPYNLTRYLGGGDGTNFTYIPGSSGTNSSSYNAITSTTVVTATGILPAVFQRTDPLVNIPTETAFVGQFSIQPYAVGNTKIWGLASIYEGGGNNSLLLQGLAKWGGGAPPTMYKLVGKGTGTLLLPATTPVSAAGFITGSATANAYDLWIKDTAGYFNGFAGLLV